MLLPFRFPLGFTVHGVLWKFAEHLEATVSTATGVREADAPSSTFVRIVYRLHEVLYNLMS